MKKGTHRLTFLLIGLWVLSCASLSSEVKEQKSTKSNLSEKKFQFRSIVSREHKEAIEIIKKDLIKKGFVFDEKSNLILEVALEEMESSSGFLRLINVILTMGTRTVIPFYNRVDYKLSYRIYEQNELKSNQVFHLSNKEFFGILILPLSPFFWSRTIEEKLLLESTELFR